MHKPKLSRVAALFAFVVAGSVSLAPTSGAFTPGQPHYPDLQTVVPPFFVVDRTSDEAVALRAKLLRFANVVMNRGDGPFEIFPQNDLAARKTKVFQRVFTHGSRFNGRWVDVALERPAGTSVFHPEHDHYHFSNFARYELRAVAADDSIGKQVRGTGEKTTFCLIDSIQLNDRSLEHRVRHPEYTLSDCETQTGTTGISVGWADIYDASLPEQWVDVTNVADGVYWLVSIADPANLIAETDDANNQAAMKINIQGDSVTAAS